VLSSLFLSLCYWISLCFIHILCCARFLARGKKEISIKFNNKAIEKRLLLHIFLSHLTRHKGNIKICMYTFDVFMQFSAAVFRAFTKEFPLWWKRNFSNKTSRRKTWNICFDCIKRSKFLLRFSPFGKY
jgi:hypothetical protein